MYEELVKRLRAVAGGSREEKCDGCPYEEDYPCCVDCLDKLHKQAADAIEELNRNLDFAVRAEAAAVKACTPRWIPVTERLPLYGQDVLAVRTYWDGEKCQEVLMAHIAVWDEETGAKWWNAANITHWMPLPQPPTECRQTVTDSNQLIGDSEQLDEPVSNPYKLEE